MIAHAAGGSHRACSRRRETGAAVVEFAIVLPLLLLLFFGIVEFGLMLYDKAVITNASREAARAAVVYNPLATPPYPSTSTIGTNETTNVSTNLISLGSNGKPSVTFPSTCVNTGDALTVTVSYTYTGLSIGKGLIMGTSMNPLASTSNNSLTMSATTTMRCE
ncbi:TadE/TadG family type IV pilus assembly protein [Burkholderia guangdongensis]|uniref:TadE/TadG family type IV pilus assembly protein n=1 Tax=Burkholderia guangdongensis TaxID=1792500 RepID=UPI0015CD3226